MKKYFILLAAAAMMLPLASCHKDPKPSVEPVEMKPAATADVAKTVSFSVAPVGEKPTYTAGNVTYEMISIEFTENSRYILQRKAVATKAEVGEIDIVTGPYTESAGTYKCTGDFEGSVTVTGDGSSKEVTVTAKNEQGQQEEQKTTASVTSTTAGSTEKTNAARTWKVANCVVAISGKGVNVNKGFTGCNLQEIATYVANNGGEGIDPKAMAGYTISEFNFSGANTIVISFTGASAFGGSYTLNGDRFSMNLEIGGNDFINTTASGTLTFPENGKAELSVSVSFKGYTGTVDFNLVEAK